MLYPTLEEVATADHLTLCKWYRFLPSPGTKAIGTYNFHDTIEIEASIMDEITKRLRKLGGFTPEISKTIEWND